MASFATFKAQETIFRFEIDKELQFLSQSFSYFLNGAEFLENEIFSSILLTFQDSLLAQQGQLGHLSSYETFLDCLNQSNPDLSSSFVLYSFLTL